MDGKLPKVEADVSVQDCISGMKKLPENSVDVVVTSPPYNLGKDYNKYLDKKSQQEYLAWSLEWVTEVARVLKTDGSFFLNLGSSLINPTIPHEFLMELVKKSQGGKGGPFLLQNTIHWIKSITIVDDDGKDLSKGHFKPINSPRFVNDCHEYIFHLTHSGNVKIDRLGIGVEYKHKSNIKRWKANGGADRRCRGNTWYLPYKTIHKRDKDRPHPATFPPELPENCIKLHGNKEESVVLDPFLGLGNSWIAAVRCEVKKFIGFDVDDYYFSIAEKSANDPEVVWDFSHCASDEEVEELVKLV